MVGSASASKNPNPPRKTRLFKFLKHSSLMLALPGDYAQGLLGNPS